MPVAAVARLLPLSLLLVAGLLAGCARSDPSVRAVANRKPAVAHRDPEAVKLQVVKSEDVESAIQARKGSIVVVDFWATWCPPCKRDFPHLVEMHEKLAGEGVACLSVSVDDEPDREDALAFLRQQHAEFPNYLLDEEARVWQEKWSIKGVPVVLVFDRDGKLVRKFDKDDPDNQFSPADVSNLVERMLATGE